MKNVVIALALIAVAFLLGRRSVKPEIVEIHRTDTVVVRDTVRETVLVPKIRYLTRVDTVRDVSSRSTVFVPGFIRFLVPDFKEKRRLGAFDFRHFSCSCAGSVRYGFVPALRLRY